MEKADMATAASVMYPAIKTKTALYHNSKLKKSMRPSTLPID